MTVAVAFVFMLVSATVVAWCFHRERCWRSQVSNLAAASGLTTWECDKLAAHITGLTESRGQYLREAQLRRRSESLLDEVRQGVLIVDDQLRIKFCNRTTQHLFQCPKIEQGRTRLEELQEHQVTEAAQSAIQTNHRCVREIELTPSLGSHGASPRYYLIEAVPVNGDGESGAWLMVHDVTEQTMADQIRKDFVANASHELRTPLTLINGYIEILQSGAITNAVQQQRSLAVMEKHGQRIARIVEDMLTISRLESGMSGLTLEPFAVRSCVNDVTDRLSPLLDGRNAGFEIDFPPDGGHLQGDRFYWDQIFTNLFENSLKENPNPGLVVQVTGRWFQNHCEITVSDNGIGIPSHDLPFIFKRFYRGHKHHSQQIKGSGLGLSIVRRSVEAHGGTIEVTSTPGLDTTFTIKVPLPPPSSEVFNCG